MELKIRPFFKNSYPKQALLIVGPDARAWLKELYRMQIDPEKATVYALPGKAANQVFGCLAVPHDGQVPADAQKNSYMQCVGNKLFIPENTIIYPEMNHAEWTAHFTAAAYVMHQEIGLAELSEEIDWSQLIEVSSAKRAEILTPSKSIYIPETIRSISVEADEEKLAENIENQAGGMNAADMPFKMDKIMKGNSREIDKLLDYLEKNPEKALFLGIPLDALGSSRGGGGGRFLFGKIRAGMPGSNAKFLNILLILCAAAGIFVFLMMLPTNGRSIFPLIAVIFIGRLIYSALDDNPPGSMFGNSGRVATIDNEKFDALQNRYEKLAKEFVEKKEYQKAAGIYLKLLKNHYRAAETLEEGGLYGEAGAIYLKYCKDKARAAACFEKGRLYNQAIDIYTELNEWEKVGDLYTLLKQENKAMHYYDMVAEDYVKKNQYVKASLIYRKKMMQPLKGQELLMTGWHKKMDANNCLNNYFANIDNTELLLAEIYRFYREDLEESRREAFLHVLKIEFHKHAALQHAVRDIAYEIIAGCLDTNPLMASELIGFNPKDKSLTKDILKFKASRMKRG